jgi:NadR type nicotinamide-nucleotide adenylyltransferase
MKKVVIIGPESTGKSTLCTQLAAHYKTLWCPEYAREYLLQHGVAYVYEDLLTIAKGQLALEEKYTAAVTVEPPLLFIDTDLYVMKVWSEFVFGRCHEFILGGIAKRHYDLYLLCDIDLPWTEDELREYPDVQPRKELFRMYKDLLVQQNTPWALISGDYEKRLQQAKAAVAALTGRA